MIAPHRTQSSNTAKTDTFGCSLAGLDDDRRLAGAGINFYRKASAAGSPGLVTTPATQKGYLIGITLEGGHRRRVFREHHSSVYDFEQDAIYVRDLSEDYKAELSGAFNFVLLEVSREMLREIADDEPALKATDLQTIFATPDPTLAGLARALFSWSARNQAPSSLFIDQMSIAMGVHLLHRYGSGGISVARRQRTLSRWNENKAKALIASRLSGDVSVAELASECNLSAGMFIRAFRQTTGRTPHQWLTEQRVQRAQDLLLKSQTSLVEISAACGFADQSHFTRVFSKVIGTSPGAWRKMRLL
ncbi:AraC family transcriptional regulator [Rhizobium sp. 18055]|uniref:AraC family transcriptional regulator n=1 Tax=Rhizobium sp. 18055 TaxID=2681403 RepID=UPI00135C32BC|nr:AraC family transcriptional regulator [Rhizobium sp. 18055]